MLIFAHRGASNLEPENTLRFFTTAQEYKIDMIELDVRETLDHELVVIHDPSLHRFFKSNKLVALTHLSELKRISKEHGREIPTLAEALSVIRVPLNIHVKVHGVEQKLLQTIKNFSSRVLISSTYPKVLKKIRALDKKIDLGLIIGKGELHLAPILHFITKDLNLYSINPKYVLINALSIRILKTLGRKIFVWTVDEPHEFERMKKLGVDGIFSNSPQLFARKI